MFLIVQDGKCLDYTDGVMKTFFGLMRQSNTIPSLELLLSILAFVLHSRLPQSIALSLITLRFHLVAMHGLNTIEVFGKRIYYHSPNCYLLSGLAIFEYQFCIGAQTVVWPV